MSRSDVASRRLMSYVSTLLAGRPRAAPAMSRHIVPTDVWDCAAIGLLVAAAVIGLFTFAQYGVTWDEDVHNWYGNFALDYYLSLFADRRALHWQNLYNYGAAFDLVAAVLNRFSPLGVYETRHLLNAGIGIVG